MELKVESATIGHLDTLYQIERECFDEEAFTRQQIAYLLKDYNCINLVARKNNEIIGFIISAIDYERNAQVGHILTIDVAPAYRQKGVAQKLLQEIEKIFKEKGFRASHLEVREDNIAALGLYQKLGYKKIAKLKNYYGNAHGMQLKKDLT
jgi:ribosomal-protein-alanine acetyltransferase